MPVFDDKTSFEVRVSAGKVSISPEALAEIMNSYVFARSDAPLKTSPSLIDKDRLIIKGKLHTKGDIPFGTAGRLSTTPDGHLRVHTEKITALKIPVKGMMGLFGIELAKVVNTSKIDGMDADKDDLLMDLGRLLPPPHIKGKVTGVRIENNAIVTFLYGSCSIVCSSGEGQLHVLHRKLRAIRKAHHGERGSNRARPRSPRPSRLESRSLQGSTRGRLFQDHRQLRPSCLRKRFRETIAFLIRSTTCRLKKLTGAVIPTGASAHFSRREVEGSWHHLAASESLRLSPS